MTDLLERAVDAVRRLRPAEQDTIAQAMLSLAGIGGPDEIELQHRAAVAEGMAKAERGEFVSGTAGEIVARAFDCARR